MSAGPVAEAIQVFLAPDLLLWLLVGAAAGILIGALPGLTAVMAITILLPFTFTQSAERGLAILISVYTGGMSGGLISAILLRMPGTPSSIATTFDGYPMAQQGRAARAMGVGILASFFGTVVGALLLTLAAPPLARFALSFGSFEYFALSLLALSVMVSLSGKSVLKGLLSGLLGLWIASIGSDPVEAVPRFTLGLTELQGGLALLPVLVGVFAVSQVLRESEHVNKAYLLPPTNYRGFLPSLRELRAHVGNAIRSALIGVYVGALPGTGGDVAGLLAYDWARRRSRHPERFGQGAEEGVVASESANNGVIGGALIPTLTLGIPGNAATAILLAGLTIHGLNPGPFLFRDHKELVYSVFAAVFISAFLVLVVQLLGIRLFVGALQFPKHVLLPVVLMFCFLGSFALNNRIFDIWVLIVFGVLGYVLERGGFPLGPLVLGVILGPIAENHLRIGLMTSMGSFTPLFARPLSLAILVLAVASFLSPLVREWQQRRAACRKGAALA
ncbi:MAG: tripartite tricarboxylate transporter permease [Bacillota bacterium]